MEKWVHSPRARDSVVCCAASGVRDYSVLDTLSDGQRACGVFLPHVTLAPRRAGPRADETTRECVVNELVTIFLCAKLGASVKIDQ